MASNRQNPEREGEIIKQIRAAVRSGQLKQPFNAEDFKRACPGWGYGTYHTFLGKHAVGNPGGNTELFSRVSRGFYELNKCR